MQKLCRCCGAIKQVTEFYLSKGRPTSPCKPCVVIRAAKWASENPGARQAAMQRHRASKDRSAEIAKASEKQAMLRKLDPEIFRAKERARYAANRHHLAAEKRRWREANAESALRIQKKHRSSEAFLTLNRVRKHRQRAELLNATPKWADESAIAQAFEIARVLSRSGVRFSVDHIVPLRHPLVCGLHVEHNLQVIPLIDNIVKRNQFTPGEV